MFDFIERLRAKPEHVRQRIAFGTATLFTGIIAVGWMAALVAGNAFILKPTNDGPTLADSTRPLSGAVSDVQSSFSNLMGGAGAANLGVNAQTDLTIIETDTSTTLNTPAQNNDTRTVIPF